VFLLAAPCDKLYAREPTIRRFLWISKYNCLSVTSKRGADGQVMTDLFLMRGFRNMEYS
jgi:hypothetical protein